MKPFCGPVLVAALAVVTSPHLYGDGPSPKPSSADLDEARRTGWRLANVVIGPLKAGDQKNYPGIQAWLKDFDKVAAGIDLKVPPAKWPATDMDALTTANPNFWQAFFEIAPGDPGLVLLHAGLLLSAGEAVRASHLLVVAKQRPGVPKEMLHGFDILLAHARKAGEAPDRLVAEGIKLHDKQDFAAALKKYEAALAAWPQNGFAHYETGLTRYHQQLVAAGQKLPEPDAVIVNGGTVPSAAVQSAYAKARKHDPFQLKAYQGDDKEVIGGLVALVKRGMPAWEKVVKGRVTDDVLEQLAGACQEANIHELALVARQVLVARRSGYAPADHPFITRSLVKLAPGKQTDQVLKRLAGGSLAVRQLVAPETGKD